MLAGCYHEGSDKHHVGLFKIGEANLEKKCCKFVENWYFTISRSSYMYNIFNLVHGQNILHHQWTWSRSSYTISSTWYIIYVQYLQHGTWTWHPTSSVDMIPRTGRRITGSSAVTGRGVAFNIISYYIISYYILRFICMPILKILRLQNSNIVRMPWKCSIYLCHPKDCHQKKKKPHTGLQEFYSKVLNMK